MHRLTSLAGLVAAVLLVAAGAHAADAPETKYVPDEPVKAKVKDIGWDGALTLGANTSLSHNDKVVGRVDGTSFSFGTQIKSGLDYLRDVHEWRNKLNYGLTLTRTPSIDSFVKTNDELALESIYLYHIRPVPWLGPFVRFELKVPIFRGTDIRPEPVQYVDGAGNPIELDDRLRLSDRFTPLNLRESAGVFAKPISETAIAVEFKAGFETRQIIVSAGARAIDSVDDTTDPDTVVAIELEDVSQGGPAFGVIVNGSFEEKKVTYAALAEAMVPVINNKADADDRGAGELTNVNIELNISFKLVSWASLDYQFRAIREPQLLDEFQLQNNLLLSFSYTLAKSAQEKKE